MTTRREFNARTKRQAWERANGYCEGVYFKWINGDVTKHRCNAPIDLGEFHYDHIDPDWYSKDNELENCQVLCKLCHKAKTLHDIKNIAKSKRIISKRNKANRRSRPMLGSKASGWKKTFNRGWVER